MPPPRRRPVQPATRIRLPRSARPGSAPPVDAGPASGPVTESGDPVTGQVKTQEAPPVDVAAGQVLDEEISTEAAGDATDDGDWPADDSGNPAATAGPGEVEAPVSPATEVAEPDRDEQAGEKTGAAAGRHPMLLPACLGALAVTLGSLAIWFGVAASSTGNGVDTQNIAVTDPAATAAVKQQIDKAFSTTFSYNYADTAKTLRAARTLLTGKAVGQYESLFKVVEQQAPKQKLVLTTTVTNSGVERLTGNTARVLIFANQRDTSGSHQISDSGAMLAINAVRVNGQWKIASIDTFSSG
jgi:Mce-associated membrane protein